MYELAGLSGACLSAGHGLVLVISKADDDGCCAFQLPAGSTSLAAALARWLLVAK
jgi:hypothetical protein